MESEFVVGMGRFIVSSKPSTLTALGLGSCVGLVIYDKVAKIGGMAHVMLPDSKNYQPDLSNMSTILAIKNPTTSIEIKRMLTDKGMVISSEISPSDDILMHYKRLNPKIVFYESSSVLADFIMLNQIRQHDSDANIVMTGNLALKDLVLLFNEDWFTLEEPIQRRKIDNVTASVMNKHLLKFADKVCTLMVEAMEARGARRENMYAKIAGGAQMFVMAKETSIAHIGDDNASSVKAELARMGIRLVAQDTGGMKGRTVRFYMDSEKMEIKTIDGIKCI